MKQLKEKKESFQARETKIVSLRRKLEKKTKNLNTSLKFYKISSVLNDIIKY